MSFKEAFFAHYLLRYWQGIVMQARICQTYHHHNDKECQLCSVASCQLSVQSTSNVKVVALLLNVRYWYDSHYQSRKVQKHLDVNPKWRTINLKVHYFLEVKIINIFVASRYEKAELKVASEVNS